MFRELKRKNKQITDTECREILEKEPNRRSIMIEIVGKYNKAICYASAVDEKAQEQLKAICDIEAYSQSKIRIMPDVHAGTGSTIGTTMTVVDKVSPSTVGVDIGCGMYTVMLGKVDIDLAALDEAAHKIPSGRDIWDERQEEFPTSDLDCYDSLTHIKRLECSLGTLGGGNHFIEVDEDDEGAKYLVIHSGSRTLGSKVAEYYQALAIDLNRGIEEYYKARRDVITTYKETGRSSEIQSTLIQMAKDWEEKQPSLPPHLCYVTGDSLKSYLHDVDICQKFAQRSREIMAQKLLSHLGIEPLDSFHTIHNYIDVDEMVLRKGAVSAKKGERLLIPINMRDGSLICIGKGNEDWNCSAPHGAGRLMSRSAAFARLTMEEFEEQMKGIYTTCVVRNTLDESPMAYKSMDDIVSHIGPTAEIVRHIKPIYNFKATE